MFTIAQEKPQTHHLTTCVSRLTIGSHLTSTRSGRDFCCACLRVQVHDGWWVSVVRSMVHSGAGGGSEESVIHQCNEHPKPMSQIITV